jgi:rhodanese-related sulfurtransferase
MKYLLLLSFILVSFFGISQSSTIHITEFSQNDIKNGILIDVRTPEEFANGHLHGAINMNWYDKDFAGHLSNISKDETIYVYCKKGGRSAKVQEKLISIGFSNVINLEGGYDAWFDAKKK